MAVWGSRGRCAHEGRCGLCGWGVRMIDIRPRRQLGYLLPVTVGDTVYYQFYRVFPPDVFMATFPLALSAFTRPAVDAALGNFWEGVDFLASRGVERIVQGGIPVSALAGRDRIRRLLDEAERKTGIPCDGDFEESIRALQDLGVRKVAVAAKWDDALMHGVSVYLEDAGFAVTGLTSKVHTAREVVALSADDGIEMAVELGREAFRQSPGADGLLLAGGAWLSLQAIPRLEAEFGRPVVTNPSATFWAALKQFGLRSQEPGMGRLLDTLHGNETMNGAARLGAA